MFNHKKTAAFLAGLMICLSTAAAPVSAYAENEDEAATVETVDELEEEMLEEVYDPTADYIVSGDFSYTLNSNGLVCIQDCSAEGTELVIPDTIDGIAVAELGRTAFGTDDTKCPFEKIAIPASVDYISSSNPFIYCKQLKEIVVDSANNEYVVSDGVLYTKDMKTLICYPQKLGGGSFTVPDGVEEIAAAALYNTELNDIRFPSSLKMLCYFALGSLKQLTAVDFSGTALSGIDSFVFSGDSALSDVKLPDTLYSIGGGAFHQCTALKDITLPEHLDYIGQYAFMDTGLKSIEIPESVTDIGYCALGYKTGSTGSEIPVEGFTVIGQYGSAAYTYCTDSDSDYEYSNDFTFMTPEQAEQQSELVAQERFTEDSYEYAVINGNAVITLCTSSEEIIDIPEKLGGYPVTEIYPIAFSSSMATVINLPETVTNIHEMAFYNCQYVKDLTLPQSVKNVGNNAFDNCIALETINLGGAETIGQAVFYNCTALKTVNLGSAETIGQSVFYGCTALKSVTISGNCKEIAEDRDGDIAFIDTTALQEIIVTEGDGNYSSENGVLYNKDKTILMVYPPEKAEKEFKAPDSVKEIRQSAFYNNKNLETVNISKVEKIGTYAFENCAVLRNVRTSKNLKAIGAYAFFNCMELKELRIEDKVETIGNYAFGYYYNEEADTENGESTDALIEGFKLYCKKNSSVYNYALPQGITVVTGTYDIFGRNVDEKAVYVFGGIFGAAILVLIGILTGKSIKKKKTAKQEEERRKEIAERVAKKHQQAQQESDYDEIEAEEENNEE